MSEQYLKEQQDYAKELKMLGYSLVNASNYVRRMVAQEEAIRKSNEAYNNRLRKQNKKQESVADVELEIARLQELLAKSK